MQDRKKFFDLIELRRKKLEFVRSELKKKFIGIDDVIDKIIDNMSLWYQTPEIQFKPLIISLWGITGVGKTDLVRTLVKLLEFNDKFIEVQMDIKTGYRKNIEDYLDSSNINPNEPSILLLDEIQRFRTIDEIGSMIDNEYFNDIWMLLSDGRFQNKSDKKAKLIEMLMEERYWDDINEDEDDEDDDTQKDVSANTIIPEKKSKKKRKYHTSYYSANRLKNITGCDSTVEDIMKMGIDEKISVIEKSIKSDDVNEGSVYNKMLIFISGNLDEAFTMAENVDDTESDADVYHDFSKRINVITIKNALKKKFKPEQIARFGNNHVIYPCLNKESYYSIIWKNVNEILDCIKNEHGIKISLTQGLIDVIYRNGVFPTQGVRPTISTIYSVLGSNIPHFIYNALLNNVSELTIDFNDNHLISNINGNEYKKEIILDVDNIKNSKSIDEKMLIAVHELGHALVYSSLFKTPPKQIVVNGTDYRNGFVIPHESVMNTTYIKNRLAVMLAGTVAEEIVFGHDFKSSGCSADIENATDLAGGFIRQYGMSSYNISRVATEGLNARSGLEYNYNIGTTDNLIEEMLKDQKNVAKDILQKLLPLY
ncbi:MAG: AAA family ATPase, partial [bacterium]